MEISGATRKQLDKYINIISSLINYQEQQKINMLKTQKESGEKFENADI